MFAGGGCSQTDCGELFTGEASTVSCEREDSTGTSWAMADGWMSGAEMAMAAVESEGRTGRCGLKLCWRQRRGVCWS